MIKLNGKEVEFNHFPDVPHQTSSESWHQRY